MKSITLTIAMAMAMGAGAEAQSISWLEKGDYLGSAYWYLPKLAGDGLGTFVVVGQDATGLGPMGYQTGTYPGGSAADYINWNSGNDDYASGKNPSVALVSTTSLTGAAVEVHQGGQENGAALWSHVAETSSPTIGASLTWADGLEYDTGYNPRVAIDSVGAGYFTVVEIHQAASGISNLWYHVGTLAVNASGTPSLTWGPSYQFDYGYAVSLAVNAGVVVEVHQGNSGTLWYSVGTVNPVASEITWTSSAQYDNGYYPSVTLTGSSSTLYVIEAHQAGNPSAGKSTALWYHISPYNSTGVFWSPAVKYGAGCRPTVVSFTSSYPAQEVAETHSGTCGVPGYLYYDLGTPSF